MGASTSHRETPDGFLSGPLLRCLWVGKPFFRPKKSRGFAFACVEIHSTSRMIDTIGTVPAGLNTTALVLQSGDTRFYTSWNSGELALSPSGKWLALGTGERVYVMDAQTGLPVTWFHKASTAWINKLAFSADDQWLCWGGWENSIYIANVATGVIHKTLSVDIGSTIALVTSPADPSLLYTGGNHQHSRLTNMQTGTIMGEIAFWDDDEPLHAYVHNAAFSPDGEHLALVCTHCLDVWNVRTLERVFHEEVEQDNYTCVAFSNDGDDLIVGTQTGLIISYNPRTGTKELEREVFQPGQGVQQVLAIPNRAELLCTSNRATAAIVSTTSLKTRVQQPLQQNTNFFQVHSSGEYALSKCGNGLIEQLSLSNLQSEKSHSPRDIASIRFSLDDTHITVGRAGGVIDCLQIEGEALTQHLPRTAGHCLLSTHGSRATIFRFSTRWLVEQIDTQTNSVLATRANDQATNRLQVLFENGDEWEIVNQRLCHRGSTTRYLDWANFGRPNQISASPDERRVAVRAAGTLTLVDTVKAEMIATAKLAGTGVVELDASSGGIIVAGKKLGFFKDNNLQDIVYSPNLGELHTVAITRDGALAAAGCNDGTVVLVRRDDMKNPIRFLATIAQLMCVRFSNDGKLIAVGGTYPVLRVYSVEKLFAGATLSAPPESAEKQAKTKAKTKAKKQATTKATTAKKSSKKTP